MSIQKMLETLEKQERLVEYHGLERASPEPDRAGSRSLWVTPKVKVKLDQAKIGGRDFRSGPIHALFTGFISGRTVHVGEKGSMKWLDPKSEGIAVVAWRATPAIRVLGGVICRDCAIFIDMHHRDDLAPRKKYENERQNTLIEWKNLFPSVAPMDGSAVDKCLTNWMAV